MYTFSSTLRTAIDNGNPQRVLLEFTGMDVSNEKILISSGVEIDDDFCTETDLRIGECPSSCIRFELSNRDGGFDDFGFGKFKAWIGARIDSGTPAGKTKTFTENGETVTYEFAPIGVFIADRPDVVRKRILSIRAEDQMQLFEADMPTGNSFGITYPSTIGAIFLQLCAKAGVEAAGTTFLNSDLVVESEPEEFENATMRDVLHWIAEAACSIARFNRDGYLEMTWFETTETEYDEHDYKDFTPSWFETPAITGLCVKNGAQETVADLGTRENAYLIQGNPFLN